MRIRVASVVADPVSGNPNVYRSSVSRDRQSGREPFSIVLARGVVIYFTLGTTRGPPGARLMSTGGELQNARLQARGEMHLLQRQDG